MAITSKLYGLFLLAAFREEHHLENDDIKTMLTTSTYVPAQDTHDYKDDVTNEVTGTGYTAGGYAHATQTLTYTAGTDVVAYDLDDATWTNATITARTAVQYNNTGGGTDASRGLIAYHNSDADISSSTGTWTCAFDASGLFTIDVT